MITRYRRRGMPWGNALKKMIRIRTQKKSENSKF